MKKLVLLLLIIPLPALAASDAQMQQAEKARSFCAARNQGPESRNYLDCVNSYLQLNYGWRVRVARDGSLLPITAAQMPPAKGNDTSVAAIYRPGNTSSRR